MMVSPPQEDVVFNTPVYEQATDTMDFNTTTTPTTMQNQNSDTSEEQPLTLVEIQKTANGFGFNIVGGTDNPHFPGDCGLYISSVNVNSKSYGVVRCGDKILSFDGIDMTFKTHDEAVDVFRSVKIGHVAKMLIDRECLQLQEEQRTQTPTASATLSPQDRTPQTQNSMRNNGTDTPKSGRLTSHGISAVIERIRGKVYEEEDAQSVTSYAPSTHSIIDDVPRTPRKPLGILDPRNNSWLTEALYVSIGLGALTLSGYLVYRFIRGRK
ncbi:hypothetical protein GCK72_016443 [Caenorhabditis remanei]|uniref:PDZ domain-containing protein n=1 Tax=Caenorhabditis remanei TaxID=31234 RepID=A0A6A5G4F2_CAERE|nr:hypothetical protein GCK72_016443 [Caenorhabditis remanei]KAF1749898.1 hypothetical protein GCK72_016443 [Caenorhabditis remanei]